MFSNALILAAPFAFLLRSIEARSWNDVSVVHSLRPEEPDAIIQALNEFNEMPIDDISPLASRLPSMVPTDTPSKAPSNAPSQHPSKAPSNSPSISSSNAPSDALSNMPSLKSSGQPSFRSSGSPTVQLTSAPSGSPTDKSTVDPSTPPTFRPTGEEFPQNPIPRQPKSTYFNYDTKPRAEFGPGYERVYKPLNSTHTTFEYEGNYWGDINFVQNEDYWYEFSPNGFGPLKGTLSGYDQSKNYCNRGKEQSPINVIDTGMNCGPHHQIRTKPGDYRIDDNENVTKQIMSNKLRIQWARRPCITCPEPDPPHADFPDGWGGGADLLHVDIKIPSEHTIEGKRYPAEYQMFHLHPGRKRSPVMSIMIDFDDNSVKNEAMQEVLDQFWLVYNEDNAKCAAKQRKERSLISRVRELLGLESSDEKIDYNSWDKFSTMSENPEGGLRRTNNRGDERDERNTSSDDQNRRFLARQKGNSTQTKGRWDPYNEDWIVKTFHFWGYKGSMTEPPCGTFAYWFVHDTPMIWSKDQINQLKTLLFTHVDENCNPTSAHYDQSVARPIQPLDDRGVFRCTRKDFVSDEEMRARREEKENAGLLNDPTR